jgi:anthranilate phosphoribosyltransferase
MIQQAIEKLAQRDDLEGSQMRQVMGEIMSGAATTPQIVSFLTALSEKGETAQELTAAVSLMRRYVTAVRTKHKVVLDTCGTGGDGKGTFNISTAAAFVVSACGIAVAKHGNRSVSSNSGSADCLEALGVNINPDKDKIEKCLDEIGIAFLFAQNFHPAMKYAMPARKEIGKRTVFNILGPLTNPAGATHQIVGVYDKHWLKILAQVSGNLGAVHALIVHGEDGLDEITTAAKTFISEMDKGRIKNYQISPEEFSIKRAYPEELSGGSAAFNAKIILELLNGKQGAKRDIVILNAAAAIYTADKVKSIKEGVDLAKRAIDSREALRKLELLKDFSKQ